MSKVEATLLALVLNCRFESCPEELDTCAVLSKFLYIAHLRGFCQLQSYVHTVFENPVDINKSAAFFNSPESM